MNSKILRKYLTPLLGKYDYILKGTRWQQDAGTFIKIIELYRSQFSDCYYVDYGFIIKDVPLEGIRMHIHLRLADNVIIDPKDAFDLLDFENQQYQENEQMDQIFSTLIHPLITYLDNIKNENEVRKFILELPTLNMIPLVTKEYFKIEG